MKQTIFLFITLLTILTTIGFLENRHHEEVKGEKEEKVLTLGYCETFERLAFDFQKENENVVLRKFDSSFAVLENLKAGRIDYGLIGRRAHSFEIGGNIKETPLQEYGLTLVSSVKGFVEYDELKNLEIHTSLEEEIVKEFFDFENITYHETLSQAIELGINSAVLISWDDWNDDFQLLIPMQNGKKVEKFRTPMLYQPIK